MNCSSCGAPLLFGTTSCGCGYKLATARDESSPIELSYWEALRAFWRVYWPTQALVFILTALAGQLPVIVVFQFGLAALGLLLFVARIVARPYRGFSLSVVLSTGNIIERKLTLRQRGKIWFFLWWRQILAGLLAGFLSAPLNIMLSSMRIYVAQWVAAAAGVLVIGPILIKMLVGHQFSDFRLEAIRRNALQGAD